MEDPIWQFVISMATQMPSLLVLLVGMVLGVVWYSRCPMVSLAAIVGCVVLFVNSIVSTAVQIWVSHYIISNNDRFVDVGQTLRWFYGISNVVANLVHAAALLLLLLAIFRGRTAPMSLKHG